MTVDDGYKWWPKNRRIGSQVKTKDTKSVSIEWLKNAWIMFGLKLWNQKTTWYFSFVVGVKILFERVLINKQNELQRAIIQAKCILSIWFY